MLCVRFALIRPFLEKSIATRRRMESLRIFSGDVCYLFTFCSPSVHLLFTFIGHYSGYRLEQPPKPLGEADTRVNVPSSPGSVRLSPKDIRTRFGV